jgi:hypothetical protein
MDKDMLRENMVKEGEYNRKYAKELSRLILENPQMRVVMWINSDGISDEYASWCGDLGKPEIKEITIDANNEHWVEREYDSYEDCYQVYGDDVDDWSDEEIERKAKEIEWEKVIAANVSAV